MWLLCPENEGRLGDHFYEEGHFQSLLAKLQEMEAHPYNVVQKKDTVTFVIQNIENNAAAIEYLQALVGSEAEMTEPVT
jgi:hypothetical protein